MAVVGLLFGAFGFGILLIVLISATSPKIASESRQEAPDSSISSLDAEHFGRLVAALLEKMGLEIERIQGGQNEIIEMAAVNPTPITGGRVLVHCVARPEAKTLNGRDVGQFIRATRSAYVEKGLLFTTGVFSSDARLEAEDTPIEIFDHHQIQNMVDQHFLTLADERPSALSSANA